MSGQNAIPPKSPPRMPSAADLSEYSVELRRGWEGEKKVLGGQGKGEGPEAEVGGRGKRGGGGGAGVRVVGPIVPSVSVVGPWGASKQTRCVSPSELGVDERTWDASVPGTPLSARGHGQGKSPSGVGGSDGAPGTPFSEARTTPGKEDRSDMETEEVGGSGEGALQVRRGRRGGRGAEGGEGRPAAEDVVGEAEEGQSPRPVNPIAKILEATGDEDEGSRRPGSASGSRGGNSSGGESSGGGGSGRGRSRSPPLRDVTNTAKPKSAPRKRSEADRLALWTWEPEAARQRDLALREKLEREREEAKRLQAELDATKARKEAAKARKAAALAKKAGEKGEGAGAEGAGALGGSPSAVEAEAAAARRRAPPVVNVATEEAKSVAGKCKACSVCNGEGKDAADCTSQDELLVTCADGCGTRVHAKCFGYPLEGRPPKQLAKRGGWTCERCVSYKADAPGGLQLEKRERCALCPRRDGAMKRTTDWRWAHLSCALFIPEVFFRGSPQGREPVDLLQVPRRRFKVGCELCRRDGEGATVDCSEAGCGASFHITCNLAQDNVCEFREETGVVLNFCGRHSAQYRAKIERAGAGGALGWQIVKAKAKDTPTSPEPSPGGGSSIGGDASPGDAVSPSMSSPVPAASPAVDACGDKAERNRSVASKALGMSESTPRRGVGRPRKKARTAGGREESASPVMGSSPLPKSAAKGPSSKGRA